MRKKILLGISITTVCLVTLASLSNVVGVQTIQSIKQNKKTNDTIDQKELLFQTIVDLVNNKEIQKIILKSQISGKDTFNPGVKFSVFNTPILTKKQLKQMYTIGLILSKTISKSKLHSMVEQHKLSNQGMQKEITSVIEKNVQLKAEITQLSNLKCDCENDNTTRWSFPVLCTMLFPIFIICFIIAILSSSVFYFVEILMYIGLVLHCFWYLGP
jgi:hypothetical protein